jgi:plasmid maintenance system antidote protein VapI
MELRNIELFKSLLEDRGYTGTSFALSIGVTPPTINRLINGTRRASPALAVRIAIALDRSMSDLFRVASRDVALNG